MKKINIFCFGFGQVAKNFIKKLKIENIDINLIVTSREKSQKKIFESIEYDSLELNENFFDKKILDNLEKIDHYLISIPPISGEDIVI